MPAVEQRRCGRQEEVVDDETRVRGITLMLITCGYSHVINIVTNMLVTDGVETLC